LALDSMYVVGIASGAFIVLVVLTTYIGKVARAASSLTDGEAGSPSKEPTYSGF